MAKHIPITYEEHTDMNNKPVPKVGGIALNPKELLLVITVNDLIDESNMLLRDAKLTSVILDKITNALALLTIQVSHIEQRVGRDGT